jgi:hypothetical protein
MKHLIGLVIAGCPLVFYGLLTMINPHYTGRLLQPDAGFQPLGWIISLVILLLAMMIYLGITMLVDSRTKGDPRNGSARSFISLVFAIVGIGLGMAIMIVLIFFGPALISFVGQRH